MTRTLAVFVTWNCKHFAVLLAEALLLEARNLPLDILQVDNASTDGTAEAVAALSPSIRQTLHDQNLGGAGGFAAGMAIAVAEKYDFVWLLDGDACPRPGALRALLAELTQHPDAAVAGSQIIIASLGDRVQEIGARVLPWTGRLRFIGLGDKVDTTRPAEDVDYVPACSALARVTAVEQVGGFDPSLFVFYDDIQWCSLIRRAGWQIRTAPASLVEHQYHGAKPLLPWRVYYAWRNRTLWHLGIPDPLQRLASLAWWCAVMANTRSQWAIMGDDSLVEAADRAVDDVLHGRLGRRDDLPGRDVSKPSPNMWTQTTIPAQAILMLEGPLNDQLAAIEWAIRRDGISLQGGDQRLLCALVPGLRTEHWQRETACSTVLALVPLVTSAEVLLWRGGNVWKATETSLFKLNSRSQLGRRIRAISHATGLLLHILWTSKSLPVR